jgi:membrane-bound inhibitor of C-type lysozyme
MKMGRRRSNIYQCSNKAMEVKIKRNNQMEMDSILMDSTNNRNNLSHKIRT